MSDKTVRALRAAIGAATAVLALLCAAALIVACVHIYRSGDRPFTPDSIAAAWKCVAIFVGFFAFLVIAGGVFFWLFPAPATKQKATASPHVRLQKICARLERKQYAPALIAPIEKHLTLVRIMRSSAFLVCLLAATYPLFYLSDANNFTSLGEQLNAQVVRGVVPALLSALIALVFCGAVRLLSDISAERAIVYAKAIMLLPAPAAEKKPVGVQKKELSRSAIFVAQVILIILAAIMIVAGVFNGSANDVLQKAIRICTECIGLG